MTAQSVTVWINQLKAAGVEDATSRNQAAAELWKRIGPTVKAIAGRYLPGRVRVVGESDIAQEAFNSFIQGVEGFPQLNTREDLRHILLALTVRKAINAVKHETRRKRGGGNVVSTSALPGSDDEEFPITEQELDPSANMAVTEMLDALDDVKLREVAVLKFHGHTNEEIAGALQWSVATVERRLRRIRDIWRSSGFFEEPGED